MGAIIAMANAFYHAIKTRFEAIAIAEGIRRLPTEQEVRCQIALSIEKQYLENKKLSQDIEFGDKKLKALKRSPRRKSKLPPPR